MKLTEYPQLIYEALTRLNRLESEMTICKQKIAEVEVKLDAAIANDSTLKNDQQRKGKRSIALLSDSKYLKLTGNFLDLTDEITEAKADLELLRNQFSVVKLQCRLEIANKLAGLEPSDLVGFV